MSPLLAAHIAAFAVCVAATASPGREISSYDAPEMVYTLPLACDQILGVGPHYPIGESLYQPLAITCVNPPRDLTVVSLAEGGLAVPPEDLVVAYADVVEAGAGSQRGTMNETDTLVMAACGIVSLMLGCLRIKEGRKRHRPGVRKSRVVLRMMA